MASPIFSSGNEFKPNATFDQMNAPVSAAQLEQQFDAPAATPQQMGRMTYEGVTSKTALIAIGAFIAAVPGYVMPNMMAMWISAGVAFVVSLIVIFRKKNSPGLIAIYAIAEGYFLGAITTYVETRFEAPGAGLQALVATFATFAVVLFLYRSGKVRYTSKMRRMLMISGLAYLVFCLFNLGYMLFSGSDSAWGLRSGIMIGPVPLGVVIGLVAVVIACISLIADFDFIENAVKNGAPKEIEWKAAFGLILTLVWLYIEFLRIIAIVFGRR